MKKKIVVDFFCDSKKWSNKVPSIKKNSNKIIKIMKNFFNDTLIYNVNIILSDEKKIKFLNKMYKNKNKDTDVLTFVSKISNEKLGKALYCDIFFSIDTINKFIKNKKISIYEHFNHLLIHSLLHINGYNHKNQNQFNKMKKEEIKILKNIGIGDPYKQ